jgi:hypothetical protein
MIPDLKLGLVFIKDTLHTSASCMTCARVAPEGRSRSEVEVRIGFVKKFRRTRAGTGSRFAPAGLFLSFLTMSLLLLMLLLSRRCWALSTVATYPYDTERTAHNLSEVILAPSNLAEVRLEECSLRHSQERCTRNRCTCLT